MGSDVVKEGAGGDVAGWTPYVRDGDLAGQRYIQVFFADKMLVDRVEVEQNGAAKAIEIKLAYSEDGKSFVDGDTVRLVFHKTFDPTKSEWATYAVQAYCENLSVKRAYMRLVRERSTTVVSARLATLN